MMRKLLERFHSSSTSGTATGTSQSLANGVDGGRVETGIHLPSLKERFSREFTNLYLRIADSARQQSNYAVARKYLQLTERAINEVRLHNQALTSISEVNILGMPDI